jgi:alpha-D-xyloside xylohydrolase
MPWEYNAENGRDDAALAIYRDFARLHLRLHPYLWPYALALTGGGRPIVRPLGLAFPELGKHPDDIYLLGDDLLVAPVIERGATSRRVTFPPGGWIDWWDGTRHEGEETVAAPLERIPLYLREGGAIPMLRPTIDTLSPVADPLAIDSLATSTGTMHARLVAPAQGRSLREYAGAGFELERTASGLRIGVEASPPIQLEVMRQAKPTEVTLAGAAITERTALADLDGGAGWFWDPARGGTLHVRIDSPGILEVK